jgi:hypothetical protein
MAFVLVNLVNGGKLFNPTLSLPPRINRFPPNQSQPLIDEGLSPLTMGPPPGSESLVIARRYGVFPFREFPPETFQGPPGVKIRSHNQDAFRSFALQTFFRLPGFVFG